MMLFKSYPNTNKINTVFSESYTFGKSTKKLNRRIKTQTVINPGREAGPGRSMYVSICMYQIIYNFFSGVGERKDFFLRKM